MSLLDLLKRPVYKEYVELADHFSATPEPTFWSKWFGGIILPIFLGIYALRCCISQCAVWVGDGSSLDLCGEPAVFFGLTWLSGALFLHFHYFWTTLRHLWVFTNLGKTISLLCLIASFWYVLWMIAIG